MSFGAGGGGALPNHQHTNIPLTGGPLDFVNTTIASLSAGSVTYSSGAALQELTIGGAGTVLGSDGAAPTWVANTANPLIKVTKTFADIVIAGTYMDIYELPQDAAAVNIWTDITKTQCEQPCQDCGHTIGWLSRQRAATTYFLSAPRRF